MRTLVHGGTVVAPGGTAPLDVLVERERIAALLAPGTADVTADAAIDATGLVVLPGGIDAHTHVIQDDPEVAEPSPDEFEGFAHGGRAAAAGGITTFIEMPHATPPSVDGPSLRRKLELAQRDAIVDFGLWGGVAPGQDPQAVVDQLALGAAGLKAYMCGSDPLLPGIGDAQLVETLELLATTTAMLGLHAESDPLLTAGLERMQREGRRDPLAHADSRPPLVEIEAVARAILYAEHTGGWAHIVHLSTAGAGRLVRDAKHRGLRVTAETCPQYLLLDHADLERLAGLARCAPPIRERADVEGLWELVADGTIDCITSDHCCFTAASKAPGRDDIWQAPNGLTGIQTLLPLTISEGRRRGLDWQRIAELTATAPARLWGLAPRKGAIAVGADADLVLVDPARSWTVRPADLLGAQRWSPFEGAELDGRIVRTIRRGETVYDIDAPEPVAAQPGSGRFIAAHHLAARDPVEAA